MADREYTECDADRAFHRSHGLALARQSGWCEGYKAKHGEAPPALSPMVMVTEEGMMMQELIDRLEKATGPDRQLDRMIEETLPGVRPHFDKRMVADGYVFEANGIQAYLPAHYTASIDAALALVPEEWVPHELSFPAPKATVNKFFFTIFPPSPWATRDVSGMGNTAAIAVCIAALKARAALTGIIR